MIHGTALQFTCYVGRGKTGKARTGKPRLIYYDMSGTGEDHQRLDAALREICRRIIGKSSVDAMRKRIDKIRKVISDLAPGCLGSDELEVTFADNTSIIFRIFPNPHLGSVNPC